MTARSMARVLAGALLVLGPAAALARDWHERQPVTVQPPDPSKTNMDKGWRLQSARYRTCQFLSGSVLLDANLQLPMPESMRFELTQMSALGPMLLGPNGDVEGTLSWQVDWDGIPIVESDEADKPVTVDVEKPEALEYRQDLQFVRDFASFIDFLSEL